MRLVQTLVVRDEIDLIDDHICYHRRAGVDHFLVTDNGSVDGTRERLQHYADLGWLDLTSRPAHEFAQYRWVTQMARDAYQRLGADWVIHADADEFFVSPEHDLKQSLAAVDAAIQAVEVQRHDFVLTSYRPRGSVRDMVVRKTRSTDYQGRPLKPKVVHRGRPDIAVAQGNHDVNLPASARQPWSRLEILHYPVRSYRQFQSKVTHGGNGYGASRDPRLAAHGGHKRRWYDLLRRGLLGQEFQRHLFDAEEVSELLASGWLVEDRRMVDFLAEAPDHPSGTQGSVPEFGSVLPDQPDLSDQRHQPDS